MVLFLLDLALGVACLLLVIEFAFAHIQALVLGQPSWVWPVPVPSSIGWLVG